MPLRFRLHYQGPLPSANHAKDGFKHRVRVKLHPQVRAAWSAEPMLKDLTPVEIGKATENTSKLIENLRCVGPFRFAALASRHLSCQVALDFLLLRPDPLGAIFNRNGDIDNRIKTIIDCLRVPDDGEMKHIESSVEKTPDPCFCLMDDDSIVSRFSVVADRLLAPEESDEVLLIAEATIWTTSRAVGNPFAYML